MESSTNGDERDRKWGVEALTHIIDGIIKISGAAFPEWVIL